MWPGCGLGIAFMFVVATLLFAGKADQTWVCVESSFSSELAPGPTPGCGNAVPAEQVRANYVLAPQSTIQPVAWAICARGGR